MGNVKKMYLDCTNIKATARQRQRAQKRALKHIMRTLVVWTEKTVISAVIIAFFLFCILYIWQVWECYYDYSQAFANVTELISYFLA